MKQKYALALLVTLACAMAPAQAVVEAGHWQAVNTSAANNTNGSNFNLNIDQTPSGDFTGTFFDYNSKAGTLKFLTLNIDEGSTLFVSRNGQFINDNTVANLAAKDKLSFSSNLAQVGTDFYIGGATEKFSDLGFQFNDNHWTVFGWAHLRADAAGKLQIIGSAMSFKEGGIVTGTLAVPEASSWSMMILGLFGVAAVVRTKRRSIAC